MNNFCSKYILLLVTGILSVSNSFCQPCLTCYGGSYDGAAIAAVASCSASATIFAGGMHAGFSGNFIGVCSGSSEVFASGGSYDGSSGATFGACSAPSSIASGGAYDGSSGAIVSSCNPPVSVLAGGAFDGSSDAAVSPCNPPATVLTGGQYDGSSGASISPCAPPSTVLTGGANDGSSVTIVSVCQPPLSIMKGGVYDGISAAFDYCGPLAVLNPGGKDEAFMINLYPNPASDEFSIYFSASSKDGQITINDVLGKEIAAEYIYQGKLQYSFKADDWAEGAYVIKVVTDGKQYNKQLMVIKSN